MAEGGIYRDQCEERYRRARPHVGAARARWGPARRGLALPTYRPTGPNAHAPPSPPRHPPQPHYLRYPYPQVRVATPKTYKNAQIFFFRDIHFITIKTADLHTSGLGLRKCKS